jgi:hypothetical protein
MEAQQVELQAHFTCISQDKTLEELSELLQEALDLVLLFITNQSGVSAKQLKMSITLKHKDQFLEVIGNASPTLLKTEVKLSPHSLKQEHTEEVSSLGDTDQTEELSAAKQEQAEDSPVVSSSFVMSAELEAKLKVEEPSYSDEERLPMKRHRQGTLNWPKKEYQGELLHYLPHGKGTMEYTGYNPWTYVGDWVNGVREGHGSLLFKDGIRSYVGEWANDKKNGTGTSTYFNGQVYTGSWIHGRQNGHGVLVHPDGAVYEGHFNGSNKCGKGIMKWLDGRVYTGSWHNNKRNGEGVELEPDGGKYTGRWKTGERQGEFTYEKDGTSRCEAWHRGIKVSDL